MFYLIKQLSVQKAIKIRSIFIASTSATIESVFPVVEVEAMVHHYNAKTDLFKLNVSKLMSIMSSEDKAQLEKVLPLCQKIYDSYKETVLPHLYKGAVEFNCVSSWDIYVQLKRFIPRMLDGKAVAINKSCFSLCSDNWQDNPTLVLAYTSKNKSSKGMTRRISFALDIAERRFIAKNFPAEVEYEKDGSVVLPGKNILSDVCKMLQMPIWSFNEYVKNYSDNNNNRPFYMNHDLLAKDLPDSILDLPILGWCSTFTFANFLKLIHNMYNWQENFNRR